MARQSRTGPSANIRSRAPRDGANRSGYQPNGRSEFGERTDSVRQVYCHWKASSESVQLTFAGRSGKWHRTARGALNASVQTRPKCQVSRISLLSRSLLNLRSASSIAWSKPLKQGASSTGQARSNVGPRRLKSRRVSKPTATTCRATRKLLLVTEVTGNAARRLLFPSFRQAFVDVPSGQGELNEQQGGQTTR